MPGGPPLFIHSLFRSGSTYFFQKFRDCGHCTCYQEPFNEALAALNHPSRQQRLLAPSGDCLRHPPLDRPYFYEFWLARGRLQGLFHRDFAYREYFPAPDGALTTRQSNWVSALIEAAAGRAVLQCCRSAGRAAALRRRYGGWHVHLWREPRSQWWSYKVADYFDATTASIYRAEHLPAALRAVRQLGGRQHRGRPLAPRDNYRMFYALWLDAWLRLEAHCDLSISLDRIATSAAENADCSRRLSAIVGRPLDLADVRASGMVFAAAEEDFYAEAESTVSDLFVSTRRASMSDVRQAVDAARESRRVHLQRAHETAAEQHLRAAALTLMQRLSRGAPLGERGWPARWYPARLVNYLRWLCAPAAPDPYRPAQPRHMPGPLPVAEEAVESFRRRA